MIVIAACSPSGSIARPDDLLWWWANEVPPEITLLGPSEATRGTTEVRASLRARDQSSIIEANLDGDRLDPGNDFIIDTTILPDGPHTLSVVVEDGSRHRNRSNATFTIRVDNTPPLVTWGLEPKQLIQGSAAVLRIRSNEDTALEAVSDGLPLQLALTRDVAWALVSAGPRAPIGPRSLLVVGHDAAGNEWRSQTFFPVNPADFPSENVEVPEGLAELLAPEIRAREDAALLETYQQITEPPRWTGNFRLPLDGTTITEFATDRSYNGGPKIGPHAGIDIAADEEDPVLSAQAGRVARVELFDLRGNTVVLDHGHGVYTTYAHLKETLVAVGDTVTAGQSIGLVGTTGLSTGPHLHWEVWVNGINIEPRGWTKVDLPRPS